jgi:glyoxylase-like metal-dependent hydrolase (beta-lactamase superfamily II)
MDPSSHQIRHITPHVYWLTPDHATDRPVLGAVAGAQATLLVDAGNSPAHARLFLKELARLPIAPPKYLAFTHWHWDHVFGAHTLDLPTFASYETTRVMSEMAHQDWSDEALDRRVQDGSEIPFCRDNMKIELPDRSRLVIRSPEIAYRTQVEIDLGGIACQLTHVGGDHDEGSSVVYVQEDQFLFLGDCLGEDYYHGPPHYSTGKLFPLLDRILSFDAEYFLEGHAPDPNTRQQMEADAALLKAIGRAVERIGPNREAVLSTLPGALGRPLDDDIVEIADAFITGLKQAGG